MKEIYNNIIEINIPLPGSPLKTLSAYLIKGERNLLIDTGLNIDICIDSLKGNLKKLNVSLDNTDIFLTHVHSDHSGMVSEVLNENNKLYMSYLDGKYLNELIFIDYDKKIKIESKLFNIPKERVFNSGSDSPESNIISHYVDFISVAEEDTLKVGDYTFEVIEISGHTPGHVGLYERKHKIFFCGDHIMNKISPNIVCWNDCADSLQLFTDNLKKVKKMDIDYMFPGHRGRVIDWKARIDDLIEHHEQRCDEVLDAIKSGKHDVYQIAEVLNWDYKRGRFNEFHSLQVWFGTSETYAHLEHIRKKGRVSKKIINNKFYYELI